MPVNIQQRKDSSIHVSELRDGQIAEIVSWNSQHYIRRVVQRCGKTLITIGRSFGYSWNPIPEMEDSPDFRVRVLGEGETLEITDNQ